MSKFELKVQLHQPSIIAMYEVAFESGHQTQLMVMVNGFGKER